MVLNIVFFLVSILILSVIYIILRRRIDKLTDPERLTNALAGDLDIILAEINQATERNVLVIEDKISELEKFIETAEKRITLLRKSLPAETKSQMIVQEKTPPSNPVKKQTVNPQIKSDSQFTLEMNSEKDTDDTAGELTYSHLNRLNTMSGMVTPLSVPEKRFSESESIQEKVLSLYKKGIDTSLIASNVGVNRGEVELIISLYKQTNGGFE